MDAMSIFLIFLAVISPMIIAIISWRNINKLKSTVAHIEEIRKKNQEQFTAKKEKLKYR